MKEDKLVIAHRSEREPNSSRVPKMITPKNFRSSPLVISFLSLLLSCSFVMAMILVKCSGGNINKKKSSRDIHLALSVFTLPIRSPILSKTNHSRSVTFPDPTAGLTILPHQLTHTIESCAEAPITLSDILDLRHKTYHRLQRPVSE